MEIRDNRQKEWFWLDNEYLNGYAKHLGPTASLVYISLCRHSDNKTQKCFPSMELIAEELGMQRASISRAVQKLSDWNIISITESYDNKNKRRNNNVYTLLAKSQWKEKPSNKNENGSHVTIDDMDSHVTINAEPCNNDEQSHVTQSYSNNTHINNTQLTIQAKQALQELPKDISEVIKQFESVNKACADFYGNTTQRKAVEKLINSYGYEMVINVVKFLPKMNKILYTKATTPVELWNKWAKIEAEASKLKESKKNQKYAINNVY